MSNLVKTYRNRVSGVVAQFPESVARAFDYLEEVNEDAKPLAYVPITPRQVEEYRASLDKGSEDTNEKESD